MDLREGAAVILVFDFGAAMVLLENEADAFVSAIQPGTHKDDRINVVITEVDLQKTTTKARQIALQT